MLYAKPVVDR